ncbi:MAG TPA: hypothetical protein VF430_02015 [Verrucomicrobiae bacterium]
MSLNNPHIATMEADPIPHCGAGNQDDAVALSLWLNETSHSLDATSLRLKVAAKVQTKKV